MRECLSNALAAWSHEDFATALKEYLKNLIMSTEQERMDKYQEQFAQLLAQASAHGVVFDDKNKKLQNELYPKSPLVLWTLGNAVMSKDPFESLALYAKAGSMSGGLDLINTIGSTLACRSTIVSTWHIAMVNDHERNQKFNQALSKIIKPTSKVIDIGAGTGLLSMLAARYTHKAVDALEGEKPMAGLAARCVMRNNLEGRVLVYPMMSSQYTPGQAPDVIVSETMDAGGLGEKMLQIFHDAHTRYKLDNADHKITFCPNKLTFFVVLIQSDSFWKTRMHVHCCKTWGCDASCHLAEEYGDSDVVVTDHEAGRCSDTSYTTFDPEDFDDVVFLSEHTELCPVRLDNEQILTTLKNSGCTSRTFRVPITKAGRVDAALICWRATLAEGVELDSVREGGWDYAAYPLMNRMQYAVGDKFNGEYVINFQQGITINNIRDPATTPGGRQVQNVKFPFGGYVMKKDDGVVELCNNESLQKFLSATPTRLPSWLCDDGQDPFFPITSEGTLQYQYLEKTTRARKRADPKEYDTIHSLKAYGCLFQSDHINRSARPKSRFHLGVDLTSLEEFSLPEYREIRGAFRGDGRFKMLSEPVLLIDLDPRREYEVIVTGEQCEATATDNGAADGILYWWVLNGEWDNVQAGLPQAAFLFPQREWLDKGETLRFNVFMKDSEFIISHGHNPVTASPEDRALAAPVAPAAAAAVLPPFFPAAAAARTTDV